MSRIVYKDPDGNFSSLVPVRQECSLALWTFVVTIASALGLPPLSGSCACSYVASILIFWIASAVAVRGTLADTLLLATV